MAQNQASLKSGIDPASFSSVIKPTDDLFRYVNGPWIDTYRLPDDRSRYGSFDKLAEDAENQVREILEDDGDNTNPDTTSASERPATKSRALYHSFLNTKAIEAAGITPLKADLDAIDNAADKAELTRVLGRLSAVDGPDLFGLAVYGDPGAPEYNIAHIEQAGILLPDEAYYREDHYAPVREAYVTMVAIQLVNAGYAPAAEDNPNQDDELPRGIDDSDSEDGSTQTSAVTPSKAALDMARRLLDVETRIAANHWDNVATRDSVKTYNPTDYADLKAALSHFDMDAWIDAWQAGYDATPAAAVQPIDFRSVFARVIVHEPSFLTGLDAFWNDADLDDLKLWARVHLIVGNAAYLSRTFDATNFDFFGKVLSGQKKQRDRWKRGVSLVNGICGEDVGREYVRRHFPESAKRRMEQLVANLIDAYRVSIANSDWLGDDTKAKALEKLTKFTPKIGYTNHWRDYTALDVHVDALLADNMKAAALYETGYQLAKVGKPVDKDEWLMNPQTVNAYYEPTMNVIVFPAAILQPPFFDPDAEDAANYGGIGAVIGHEIGHGFDDQGSQYDGDGKLNNWWTDEDRRNFEARTKALIDQYNSFVPLQLAEKYADEPDKAPHVNGALTIGENIGDLGGVNIALKAYAFALGKAEGKAEDGSPAAIKALLDTAPDMDGFTGLQRFFLSYASIWRTKNRDELAEQYLQIDPHSPAEFRTNGIARNVDFFYDAFSVTKDDAMWFDPADRVRIW
ncbi:MULTISPECIES: M13 family metallopeptidase [Bifidobacterium]|uniref:Zinc metalloprotease n=1 Tax=Bifidobacterium reuteri DSM 23975 TaxID=1437610 RepID=A0A087CMK9_9BIFI|nr:MULTISPECIES: M13-type metalloendopeptidase [Bifidobacterium]KFI84509.1 Zinc metalloprotease [Bifidobacterium reuteri DSM 23975]TPF78785.1 peptidase M13 [Bifidobacterium sp. UTCIF-1]TPF80722.1 peptidase M13 [Bifidobacterium sp. UTCIF-24]TPF82626.1 peptidase M13 [Bifidobacterium sp. UTCIF-3]TPF84767.1 peptidase M13 [Bifidobacterium sp. UTCIF-36]